MVEAEPRGQPQAQAAQDVKKVRTDPALSSLEGAFATLVVVVFGGFSVALGIGFGSGWPSSSSDIAIA